MELIPTAVHGVVDYMTAGMLFSLPRVLGFSRRVTTLMTGAAVMTAAYSMMTRYEMGVYRRIPMPLHLTLDKMSGFLFLLSPLAFMRERAAVKAVLAGIGLFEIIVPSISQDGQPQGRLGALRESLKKIIDREAIHLR
jgi:hypothetical protein